MNRTAEQVLQQEFLLARAKILELSATLDRIESAEGDVATSPQMVLLQRGLDILRDPMSDKAKRFQLLFSRDYDPGWRKTMNV